MFIKSFLAFGAGFISFLTPCVLPIIPGYISYITGKKLEEIDEDKKTVSRARKIEKFLSQPFFVAEVFTGAPGKYVSVKLLKVFKHVSSTIEIASIFSPYRSGIPLIVFKSLIV